MIRKIQLIHTLAGIVVACGPAQLSSESTAPIGSKAIDVRSKDVTKALKTESNVEAQIIDSGSGSSSTALSFSVAELSLNQGESKDVDVQIRGGMPNEGVTLTSPTLAKIKVDFLNSAGSTVSGPIMLDADGQATLKIRVSSVFERTPTKVTAPGQMNASLQISGSAAGLQFAGTLPIKVSNIALFVMTGVTNVRDLPATFEFPAGTIPVFANPPTMALVRVMHFQGGGGSFRHQNNNANMPANNGYCPINNSTSALVLVGGQMSASCLPCPSEATTDMTGQFYNHNVENAGQARAIVCKRKI
jgi:hypothetical protein